MGQVDQETVKLIGETNQLIQDFGKRVDERFTTAEKDRGEMKVRMEKFEEAGKTNRADLDRVLNSIPDKGGSKEKLIHAAEKGERDRKLMNEQARLILTAPNAKAVEPAAKALQMGIGASGGFLVGTQMSTEIIDKGEYFSVMLKYADVMNVGDTAQGTLTLEDGDFTWSSVASLAQPTETAFATFIKQLAWALTKQGAFATMDNDLMRYAEIDLAARLTSKGGRSLGNKADDWFVNGSGSGEPNGLRNSQSVGTLAQAGSAFDWDDLTSLEHTLLPYYRGEAVFLMNDTVHQWLVEIEDATGRPMFEGAVELKKLGLDSDYPQQTGSLRLPGRTYPYFVVNTTAIPADLGAGAESEVWFGVPRFYQIRHDRNGLEISMDSTGANWRIDQTQIKLIYRPHGILTHGETWAYLSGAKQS